MQAFYLKQRAIAFEGVLLKEVCVLCCQIRSDQIRLMFDQIVLVDVEDGCSDVVVVVFEQ